MGRCAAWRLVRRRVTASLMGQSASTTVVVTNATLLSTSISPGLGELPIGMYKQYSLIGTFSDGTTQDLTSDAIFQAPAPTIASLVPQGLVLGVGAGLGQITAQLGYFSASTPVEVTNASLTGFTFTPATSTLRVGLGELLTAVGTFSDGYTQNLVNNAIFSSSDLNTARVIATGATGGDVLGNHVGTATITAAFRGQTQTATVQVLSSTITSIALTPANPTLNAGTTLQLTATATYDDGTTGDVTSSVIWSSSATNLLSVSSSGLLTAYATTQAVNVTVTAQSGNAKQSFTVSVQPAGTKTPVNPTGTLQSIAVGPSGTHLPAGAAAQLTATGTYSDGTAQDLTNSAVWTSGTPANAIVSNVGLVTGRMPGQASIKAAMGGVSGSTLVVVSAAAVKALAVSPTQTSFAVGATQQYTVTATFTDGTTQDATAAAAWSSSNPAVATIGAASGRATGVTAGSVQFTASYGGQTATVSATVTPPAVTLTSLVVQPTSSSIATGSAEQHTVTAFYSDGSQQDVTGQVTWTSSTSSAVSNAKGSTRAMAHPQADASTVSVSAAGVDTAINPGTAAVSASLGSMMSSSVVIVTAATVTSLDISATDQIIPVAAKQRLLLTGTFSDHSSQDLTLTAGWQSSNPAVATIDSQGWVTGVSAGPVVFTASFGGFTASTVGFQVTSSSLVGVSLSAPFPSYEVGLAQQLSVLGTYADGSIHDLTTLASYKSSDSTILAVDRTGLEYGVIQGTAQITATVNGLSSVLTLASVNDPISSIQIEPNTIKIVLGTHYPFNAQATSVRGFNVDITAPSVWSVADPSVLTIAQGGLAKSGRVGTTTVSSSELGVTGTTQTVTVTNASLVGLVLDENGNPATPSTIAAGTAQKYTAIGYFDDGSAQGLTSDVVFDTTDNSIASVDPTGLVQGLRPGKVQVTISFMGKTASAALTVTSATLSSVSLLPGDAELPAGFNRQYALIGTFSDGSTQDLSYNAIFGTSTPSIIGLNQQGVILGIAPGVGQLTAQRGYFSASTPVNVTNATLTRSTLSPASATVRSGHQQHFVATGTFSDGYAQDIGLNTTFTSSAPDVGLIVPIRSLNGFVAGLNPGTAQITATTQDFSASSTLTVLSSVVSSIALTPANPSLSAGSTQQITATATYADGSTADVTSQVTFTSSQPAVAMVSSSGLLTGVSSGATTITATLGTTTATSQVTVNPMVATLISISVMPSTGSLVKGGTQQFTVTGTYSDGSTRDLTSTASYASSNPSVLSIDGMGLATATGVGTAQITVFDNGQTFTTQPVTVAPATLSSVVVTPTSTRLAAGTSKQLTATATYSDGSTQNVTGSVTWSSAAQQTATVSSSGVVTGLVPGQVSISATLPNGTSSVTSSSTVIVSAAVLQSLAISPSGASFAAGTNEQYTLTGTYSDGSTQDLTMAATWTSATPAVATIGSSTGLATGVAPGSVQFSASYNGQTATSATSTVTPAVIVSLSVTPTGASFAKGTTQQFTVIATYSDGSTHDVTNQASFTSSDPSVVSVAQGGLATGNGAGTAQLTVTVGSTSVTTPAVTVTPATLVSIAVTPMSPTLAAGTTQQFTATGTFSDGTTQNLSNQVVWTSANPQVMTIDQTGKGSTSQTGSTQVTAALNGVSGSTGLIQVTPSTLAGLTIAPTAAQIAKGTTQQFTATGSYTNGTMQDVTSQVTWTSSNGAVAGINASGLATGNGVGSAQITATLGAQSASTTSFSVTPATLVSISFAPQSPTVAAGTQTQITVTGLYSDGTTQNLTGSSSFSSSNNAVATVSTAGVITGVLPGTAVITVTTGGATSTLNVTTSVATLSSLAITPNPPANFAKGTTQQFTATGTFSDGTTQDLTASVSWLTSSSSIFTISNGGLATAVGVGSGQVTATYSGTTAQTATFQVTPATVASIAVTPAASLIAAGSTQQFSATATYSDSTTADVTGSVAWSSSSTATATISSSGLAYGRSSGATTIAAALDTVSGSTTLTVTGSAPLVSIAVSPTSSRLAAGTTQQLTVTGTYSDGSTSNLTGSATFTSAAPGTATVSGAGLVTAVTPGQASVQATAGGFNANATVVVTAATLQSLAISPSGASFAAGVNQQFTLTGTFSDGTTQNLTSAATWASSQPSVATINPDTGLATGVMAGSVQFAATYGNQTVLSSVNTVSPATLVSIAVTPSNGSFAKGTSEQFTVTGTYSDGSTRDLTGSSTYTSSNPSVISVASSGLAEGAGTGTASVTVSTGGQTFTTSPITVTPATLTSIAITPNSPSLAAGTSQQFTATGTFSDGSTQDLSSQVVWASSSPMVLTIDGNGDATSSMTGTAQVSATLHGVSATSGTVTVTPATLTSLTLSPSSAQIAKGTTQQFTATAVFTDGSTQNVSGQTMWSTSNGAVAGIDANGLATGNAVGSATITATYQSLTASTTSFTVTPATLVSLSFNPAHPTVAAGTTTQETVTGTYSDGTTQDLTGSATYTSATPSVATVSQSGLITGVAPGPDTITVSVNGQTSSLPVTVSNAILTGLVITPNPPANMPKGTTQQFTATGTYSDGTTQNLTSVVAWTTSASATATINQNGLATAIGLGTATVSASYQGQNATTSALTVVPAVLQTITVTPANGTVNTLGTLQFTATGTYTDATTSNLTTQVTWSSSNNLGATINSSGVVTGIVPGTEVITAALNGLTGTANLLVSLTQQTPTLQSIAVTPASASVIPGGTQQYTATGSYSDASTQNITSSVTWASNNGSATINASGLATGISVGSATITAGSGGVTSNNATLTVNPAPVVLTSLAITPSPAMVGKGSTVQFTAMGSYSDGHTQNLSTEVTWSSSVAGTATINANGLANGVAAGNTQITAALSGQSAMATLTVNPATLVSLAITPQTASIANGTKQQYDAIGTFSDGSTQDLSTSVTWASSNTALVTVNAAGLASTMGTGSVSITAASGAISSNSAALTVTAATVTSIQLTPSPVSLAAGNMQQLLATATFTDGTSQNVTSSVTYSSSAAGVTTVNASGLLKGVGPGTATVTASLEGLSTNLPVTVTNAVLASIAVTPANPSMPAGLSQQLTATGTYTDGSTRDLTSVATWTSSDSTTVSVTSAGNATAVKQGAATITATYSSISGATTVTGTAAVATAISVSPTPVTLATGNSQQFAATATLTDGTQQDVTASAHWSVSDPTKASISNTTGSAGLLTATAAGNTNALATVGTVSGSAMVTVTAATLTGLTINPAALTSIPAGTTKQLSVIGMYSDSSNADVTHLVTWTTGSASTAYVDSSALLHAVGSGLTTIDAHLQGVDGTAIVSVSNATLSSIAITPASPVLALGQTTQLTATGTYSDGSSENITSQVQWSSSSSNVATVSSTGLVTPTATGTSTLSATLSGVTGTTPLTVTAARLQSITVTSAQSSFALGQSLPLKATGTYSDGTTQDLTTQVNWSSQTPSVGVVSSTGIATGVHAGAFYARASLSGVTGSEEVTVTNATLVSIAVTPNGQVVVDVTGNTVQFTATGTFSDGTTQNLGTPVHWTTTGIVVGTISSTGVFTPTAAGLGTVVATSGSTSGSASLTVVSAPIL